MSRILSRRSNGAPAPAPETTDATPADEPPVAVPAAGDGDGEQPTQVAPAVVVEEPALVVEEPAVVVTEPAEGVPAGADGVPTPNPSFLTRGKLRRRLRYLRRVREIGFRDLGGLVFDLDRFGRDRADLVELKLAGLKSIDAELRALEVALEDFTDAEELLEPGISACAKCGALLGSEARFCPSCGTPVATPPAADSADLPAAAPESAPAEAAPDA
ncbi:MAG: zinc ribbon protein, partial [Solirubrobacterales bacterium]|nr:zinc ribbon protein [Solirubrobacterales bacterium]